MKTIKLQRQLSNGNWVNCDEREQEFLDRCVEFDGRVNSINEAVELLLKGVELRNHSEDWYSVCRSEIPILQRKSEFEQEQKNQAEERKKILTEKKCNIYLDVSYSQKEHAKLYGAKWNKTEKRWYYPSEAGEYLPNGLLKYESSKPNARSSSEWLAETGYDWYDQ